MITIENIIKTLKEQGVSDDKIEEINKSFLLASEIHKDQYRQSGEPYITHPLNVAKNLLDMEVYDTESLTCTMIIKGHANIVNVASLFDNKNGVITASNDNTIKIWKILKSSFKLIASINNGKYPVSQVLRFCDDKIVASIVTGAGDINIWNIKNYEKINLPKSSNFIDYLYSSSLSMVVKNNFLYVLKL